MSLYGNILPLHLITKSIAMTNKEILQADMLDILFEHRNKLYGAYALRKTYDRRLGIALAAALLTVLISLGISFLKKNNNSDRSRPEGQTMVLTTYKIPDEIKQEVKPIEKPPQKSTADYHNIVVVEDDKADKDVPTVEKISTSVIGDIDLDAVPADGSEKTSNNKDEGQNTTKEPQPEVAQPDLPSYPPEFPGGTAAWLSFLQKYLQSPDELEPGQKVQVLVRFWVDVDGSVSRAEVVKSGGSSFDKEVLRVLKKMPKWKPGMQHGNNVAMAYMQPVTFMGVEQ